MYCSLIILLSSFGKLMRQYTELFFKSKGKIAEIFKT